MSQEHHDKMEEAKNEYHTKLDQAHRDHKLKYDTLAEEKEAMRKEKDSNIRQLEREKEE